MRTPRLSFGSFRGWHLWLSIALSLPILIVALTAIFIAHDKSLGLKEINVPAGWLPGMQAGKTENVEPRALWAAPDGALWVGTKAGLFRVAGETIAVVDGMARADVRDLHAEDGALLAATTRGLYRVELASGVAERVAAGDWWSVDRGAQGLVAVGKPARFMVSRDGGREWLDLDAGNAAAERVVQAAARADDSGGVPLSRLIMDLHTGKAFFGKQYEWVWIDLIGATMALLTLTGLVMWWRGQRRKVAALEAQLAAVKPEAADAPPAGVPAG